MSPFQHDCSAMGVAPPDESHKHASSYITTMSNPPDESHIPPQNSRLSTAIRKLEHAESEVDRLCIIIERAAKALSTAREVKRLAQLELDEASKSINNGGDSSCEESRLAQLELDEASNSSCEESSIDSVLALVTGDTEGFEETGAEEGDAVTGATEGFDVTGAEEGSEVTGAMEGFDVTGAEEGDAVTGAMEGFDVTGAEEGDAVTDENIEAKQSLVNILGSLFDTGALKSLIGLTRTQFLSKTLLLQEDKLPDIEDSVYEYKAGVLENEVNCMTIQGELRFLTSKLEKLGLKMATNDGVQIATGKN